MTRTFRAFYLGRSLREKVLLLCFALILIGVWLSHFCGQVVGFARQTHLINLQLAAQERLLADRDAISAAAEKAASRFDPSSTLNGIALTSTATNLATDAGLNNTRADEEPDVSNGQFAVHTVDFDIPKADWQSLQSFYLALQKRHPYISIEQFQILQDKASHTHTVNMKLSSVEIERDAP